jgi:hypothetical protein
MAALGIIIIHYHRINAQFNHGRLHNFQTPNEQVLQKTTEKINPDKGKSLEKPFDCMGRGHVVLSYLNTAAIALGAIFHKVVTVN